MADDPQFYRTVTPTVATVPAVVPETGSGTDPNANCYIDLAYADNYLQATIHSEAWLAADPNTRAQAIISASRTLDANCIWKGYRKFYGQPLGWPRVLAENEDAAHGGSAYSALSGSYLRYYDENSIPLELKHATSLEAFELVKADRVSDPSTKGLTSMGLGQGALTMTFTGSKDDQPKPLSDEVVKIVTPLCEGFRGMGAATRKVIRVQ